MAQFILFPVVYLSTQMTFMLRIFCILLLYASFLQSCYEADTKQKAKSKNSFAYRETIITGSDTGMTILGPFKRNNVADQLCQRWELQNGEDIAMGLATGFDLTQSTSPGMAFFKDSSVVLNPFGNLKVGKWQLNVDDKKQVLRITVEDSVRQYVLAELTSQSLMLGLPATRTFFLQFSTSGVLHQSMYSDPFHPKNNQWRIKPSKKEADSAIHRRLKNCLLFFALYYRDHIKRKSETISFEGLPVIFTWYNRGIGLPDKDELSESWIDCFYDKEQALKGYSVLRRLIVDYEYDWPKGAPSWIYATHAVLEQMYHKIDKVKG